MEILITTIAIFAVVGSVVFSLMAPKARIEEEAIQRRLGAIAAGAEKTTGRVRLLEAEETFWERILKFFLGENDLPESYQGIRVTLHQAGYGGERAVRIFWGVRIFATLALAIGGFLYATLLGAAISRMLLLSIAGGGLGYYLPYFYLRRKGSSRIQKIRENLPDTLDLLVVCVEAGLGMDGALVRVGNEQAAQGMLIGEEFGLMAQELRAGVARREALSRLAGRVGLEELQAFVTFLNQTEEMGGSIARSLRVYASTMREKRSQRAEEAARKTVIKLIFPLVFLILPALFLIVMGPPVLNIMKLFMNPFG